MYTYLAVFVCALVVVCAERPQSECEKRRENALNHETIMKLIPKCKVNGDYEDLQCYKDSDFCVCYNRKGHPTSPISTKLKQCDCYLARQNKIDLNIPDSYVPQCDAEGTFSKRQCWEAKSSCWCVDENNKQHGGFGDENMKCD